MNAAPHLSLPFFRGKSMNIEIYNKMPNLLEPRQKVKLFHLHKQQCFGIIIGKLDSKITPFVLLSIIFKLNTIAVPVI